MKQKGVVYILQSEKNNSYYIGSTVNFERRIREHNSGLTRYTSIIKPFKVVFVQEYIDIKLAKRIELKLKKFKSKKIIEQIIQDGFIKIRG